MYRDKTYQPTKYRRQNVLATKCIGDKRIGGQNILATKCIGDITYRLQNVLADKTYRWTKGIGYKTYKQIIRNLKQFSKRVFIFSQVKKSYILM